ncbi:MAG: hypothetical protein RI907_887 [Pseudomonadota bacterium]|jgi:hypothetical protein
MHAAQDWTLSRNPAGRLVFTSLTGEAHEGVMPVRAFPLTAPEAGLSLVGPDGHELLWVDHVNDLPAAARQLVEEELAVREFAPVVHQLKHVSTFATPSTWDVETDRGPTSFVLKSEDDIRRMPQGKLLITAGQGLTFVVTDRFALDKHSRKLLERFL